MAMDYATFTWQREDRVATITLNRPERQNAISRADRDDLLHVIVLQGAGRAFCAGYDRPIPGHRAAARRCPGTRISISRRWSTTRSAG
jgi:enoyl-CoA hydratase